MVRIVVIIKAVISTMFSVIMLFLIPHIAEPDATILAFWSDISDVFGIDVVLKIFLRRKTSSTCVADIITLVFMECLMPMPVGGVSSRASVISVEGRGRLLGGRKCRRRSTHIWEEWRRFVRRLTLYILSFLLFSLNFLI